MHAFLATLSPSRVPTTSWPARSRFLSRKYSNYSKLSDKLRNCSRRLCSRFRHPNMQVLHLPCLWSLLLLGRPRRNGDASIHSTRLLTCFSCLVLQSSPMFSYRQTPRLPTRPPYIQLQSAPSKTIKASMVRSKHACHIIFLIFSL